MAGLFGLTSAQADVVISSQSTKNMSCSAGICEPTASSAVLNANDLENLLASGNVEVTTTGSGVQADNIKLADALSWSSSATLEFDAYQSLTFNNPLSIKGTGALSLVTNDGSSGGVLAFGPKGRASFANLSSALSINGTSYTLVDSVKSLANAIASNPSGAFALARNYDAARDGTYRSSPVPTYFTGGFEGMGNTVSNLSIMDQQIDKKDDFVGFFSFVDGTVANLKIANVSVSALKKRISVGGLVGVNGGTLAFDSVTGSVSVAARSVGGGLVGTNFGGISNCFSMASVTGQNHSNVGGLAGRHGGGTIDSSFATGQVSARNSSMTGGLVGEAFPYKGGVTITNSYATSTVSAGGHYSYAGGFAGYVYEAVIATSYSTGAASARPYAGGFAGAVVEASIDDTYWDTTTSGTDEGTGQGSVSGLTGLTTAQFQSGLPSGFDSTIWREKTKIDNGFPYLITNPPPK